MMATVTGLSEGKQMLHVNEGKIITLVKYSRILVQSSLGMFVIQEEVQYQSFVNKSDTQKQMSCTF